MMVYKERSSGQENIAQKVTDTSLELWNENNFLPFFTQQLQ